MFHIELSILSAFIMLIIEYFFIIRIYKKESQISFQRLLLSPILLIVSQYISYLYESKKHEETQRFNPIVLFFTFILLQLPFAMQDYDLLVDVPLFERLVILGIEAVSATLIAEGLLILF